MDDTLCAVVYSIGLLRIFSVTDCECLYEMNLLENLKDDVDNEPELTSPISERVSQAIIQGFTNNYADN